MAEQATTMKLTRLDRMLDRHPLPTWRMFARPVMVFMALFIFWAYFAELEEVSSAPAEVVPQGRVRIIQHLEGGIVEAIYIADGDLVKKGTPLIQLDLASGALNKEELEVRLASEALKRVRLEAEAKDQAPVFPEQITTRWPQLASAEQQNFVARRRQIDTATSILKELVKQRKLEVQELQAKRKAAKKNLSLAQERFTMSKSLLSQGLTPRIEHLKLEAEVENLDGELGTLIPAIPRAQAAVTESEQRVEEEKNKFRREAQELMGEAEQNLARLKELMIRATEQGVRAEIKSPIDGVVKNLTYNTIGGVVKPGDPIMEIVPTGDKLIIEAKLNPTDRGFVSEGQKALVKISTYDFARYGGLEGKVALVAPDASTDQDGKPYFRVVVKTDKSYLGFEEGSLPITPGMQATVDVHTGERSVMDYLVRPILKLRHEAFRER